jgi:hypothetical protein
MYIPLMVRWEDGSCTDLLFYSGSGMALKLRAVKDRVGFSDVVIAALEQYLGVKSTTKKKTSKSYANNYFNLTVFIICCGCIQPPKTSKMYTIVGGQLWSRSKKMDASL